MEHCNHAISINNGTSIATVADLSDEDVARVIDILEQMGCEELAAGEDATTEREALELISAEVLRRHGEPLVIG